MIATIVGSGTLVPHASRSTPALHVQEGDLALTIDGGSGTMRRQAELGLDYRLVDWLCFTHIHPDHTLDLLHFLFVSGQDRRARPVRLIGPQGFEKYVDHLREGVRPWTEGGAGGIAITEMRDRDSVDLGSLEIQAFKLYHGVLDMGYRITGPGDRVFAFTGDTGPGPNLLSLASGADVLVTECSTLEAHPLNGHLTAAQAGRLAEEAHVKQLVLSHLYPLDNDGDRLGEAREHYGGPILLSRDGDRFHV